MILHLKNHIHLLVTDWRKQTVLQWCVVVFILALMLLPGKVCPQSCHYHQHLMFSFIDFVFNRMAIQLQSPCSFQLLTLQGHK